MQGKTVIAIAHRLSTIAALDRLIVLDGGRIVEEGTHDELIARGGLYAELWKRQSGGFLAKLAGGGVARPCASSNCGAGRAADEPQAPRRAGLARRHAARHQPDRDRDRGGKASALGRAGDKVEQTLAALKAHAGGQPERPVLVKEAAEAVYAYFIQREICGMRRHQDVIREYAIPNEVLVRLGAK